MTAPPTGRLLDGVRVLDLTNVLSGPFCTYQLALLGADVVKIERPGTGDLARQLGADPYLNEQLRGSSFLAQNAGKRSVALDLKSEAGRRGFEKLLATADVLVENFRPGVLARLGFDWPRLQELNERLVYCSISGFGHTGPYRDRPAYDQIVQGLSGMMAVTGAPEAAPTRVGFPVCDTIGGLAAATGLLGALVARHRTGRGCRVDVSMLETSVAAMGWLVSNHLIAGQPPVPMGNENVTAAPSGTFRTRDGDINISANQQAQFERLCRVLGRPDLVAHPWYRRPEERKRHRHRLRAELETELRQRDSAEWERLLTAANIPAAPVLGLADTLRLDQLAERDFVQSVPMPGDDGRTIQVVGNGLHVDGAAATPTRRPPELGEHTEEVLAAAGITGEDLRALVRDAAAGDRGDRW